MGDALSYAQRVFTSDWAATGLIVAVLIIGPVLVGLELKELRASAAASALSGRYQPNFGSPFTGWRVILPAGSEEVNRQLLLQRNRVLGYMAVAAGMGAMLAAIGAKALLLGLYSTRNQAISVQLFADLGPTVALMGTVLGYAFGGLSTRRKSQSAASVSGARRTLHAYCSVWIWSILTVITVFSTSLLFTGSSGAQASEIHWLGAPLQIPAPIVGAVVAGTLVLTMGLPLLMAALVASSPNILSSSDALAAQRANDDLRATISAGLIFYVWITLLSLGDRLESLLSALGFPAPGGPIGVLAMISGDLRLITTIAYLPLFVVALVMAVNGRMGGRLTGWPWRRPRPGPSEQSVTAQERE